MIFFVQERHNHQRFFRHFMSKSRIKILVLNAVNANFHFLFHSIKMILSDFQDLGHVCKSMITENKSPMMPAVLARAVSVNIFFFDQGAHL